MLRKIALIFSACALGCFSVWIQNEQVDLSYSIRERERQVASLETEQRELKWRLAVMDSPQELMARLGSSSALNARPQETRWVLRRAHEDESLGRVVQGVTQPMIRALTLGVKKTRP
ncbi:MAG: hypothetical protein HYY14_00445 [Candidatus Omnitrophica bacterium]|nr:hypothetical protein [Candidatus Omnitrophota bacterium]